MNNSIEEFKIYPEQTVVDSQERVLLRREYCLDNGRTIVTLQQVDSISGEAHYILVMGYVIQYRGRIFDGRDKRIKTISEEERESMKSKLLAIICSNQNFKGEISFAV